VIQAALRPLREPTADKSSSCECGRYQRQLRTGPAAGTVSHMNTALDDWCTAAPQWYQPWTITV